MNMSPSGWGPSPNSALFELSWSVYATYLVAIRVEEITQIHQAHVALSWAWRVFNASAAISDCNIMKLLYLLGRIAYKAER